MAAIPAATAPFTAFRAAGRLMVTTATGPSTRHSTASDVPARAKCPQLDYRVPERLLARFPNCPPPCCLPDG